MRFHLVQHYAGFVLIVITNMILTVEGQCTVQGCEMADVPDSIFEVIEEFNNQLVTLMTSLRAVDRSKQEQEVFMRQVLSIHELLNSSCQQTKDHQTSVMTRLEAADRNSQEQVQSIIKFLSSSFLQMKIQQNNTITSFQAANRCSQEQDQRIYRHFNMSFQQIKTQYDHLTTRIQAVDQRSQEHTQRIQRLNNSFFTLVKDQQHAVTTTLQADHRRSQEQVQNMFAFLNSSLQQMKTQLDTVTRDHQAVQRRLSLCETSISNQTQTLWKLANAFGIGDWIVIMHRFNGSVKFNRSWTDYRNGFGDKERGEFWLGNEEVHRLTNRFAYTLRIEVQLKSNGRWYNAEYSTFSLESEYNKYTLRLSGYSGNAGDSLTNTSLDGDAYLGGMSFSTWDNDNDRESSESCARDEAGGWWFNACCFSCLTCHYRDSFTWYSERGWPASGFLRAARLTIKSK